ncbi:ATP-binding protein [Ketobacter alkanivorans]|uniref:histidine kinase n=1 Tax=Ketobacter alkanivorans TaxID=1917421 RepID=A0A2K9LMQ7_9GAMM|nr:ATP-binding protein [Ketobacter alkanivorans]AUM12765.1 hypothetical protein Kalk_10190 [Ketobacter alkanivorans]
MSKNSTDQMVLMAQMMADSDDHRLKMRLDSYLPLLFIVVVGIIVTIIALYSAIQWENHVEITIAETNERAYYNEANRNLTTQKQNTNAIRGFIESSSFVDADEFKSFSLRLLGAHSNIEFVATLNYKNLNYIEPASESRQTHLQYLVNHITPLVRNHANENAFINLQFPGDSIKYVAHILILPSEKPEAPMIIISAAPLPSLISGMTSTQHAHLTLTDSFGLSTSVDINSHIKDVDLYVSQYDFDDTHLTLATQNTLETLQSASFLKWILVAFSLVFTISLCIQFIVARRSIKNLANLAVQRANDLTAINSDLTDEIFSRIEFQAELLSKNQKIQNMNKQLEEAQNQLIQQEKLASLGQLAAGVAHEINNPVGFINSNLTMLKKYADRALELITTLDASLSGIADEDLMTTINQKKKALKIDSIKRNMLAVIDESMEGVTRVKQIVQDLKDFSRIDEAEWQWTDLHAGIDSTLNIAWNEIKYKAVVHKEYGELPNVECVPSQINQVIMNLLVNSAHAMENSGNIYLRTSAQKDTITIEVEDDGCGIPEKIIGKIFDPFFTTKEVGKGTGLGLSLSYGIIKKHNGELSVKSRPGEGTTFTITLPISRKLSDDKAA